MDDKQESLDSAVVLNLDGLRFYDAPDLEGGGLTFGRDFVPIVRRLFGHVERAYEYCCGPGAIGFSLIANNLCDSLCLSDVNPKAVELCKRTARENNLEGRVDVYLSDCLEQIPSYEKGTSQCRTPPWPMVLLRRGSVT